MKNKIGLTGLLILFIGIHLSAQNKHASKSKFMTYKGLVMAGYQGWFNCEGDGADRGWTHYGKNGKFEDGSCTIDYWPDMNEYKVKYKTPLIFGDGISNG
jgi:glycoprotein endo-alpha-1,2-mannosidase